jgi:ABC-type Fe3+-hydroxamate transport system substrate-binding protein
MLQLGEVCERKIESAALVSEIQNEFDQWSAPKAADSVYFIWKNPWMTIGGDTFINEMLKIAGFKNLFRLYLRYPEVDLTTLVDHELKYVLLSSEPYPFKEKHIEEVNQFLPRAKVVLVDGQYFSWYGSRLKESFQYFSRLWKDLR